MNEYPYLVDAAKQLEAAARRLRKASNPHEYDIVRRRLLREARTNIDAAEARIKSAEVTND